MQFVNDDMDDLYRQAAEEYPLKTDGGDWNKVLEKIQAGGKGQIPVKRDWSRYLLLLVLIPLLLVCTTYIKSDKLKEGSNLENETAIRTQPLPLEKKSQSNPLTGNKIVEKNDHPIAKPTPGPKYITTVISKKNVQGIDILKQPAKSKNKIVNSEAPVGNSQVIESRKANEEKDLISNNTANKAVENNNEPLATSTIK